MALSNYNLKRSQNKNNKKAITYVCSCISRKMMKKQKYSEQDPFPSEETNENEGTSTEGSLHGFKRKGQQKRKGRRTNIEACSFRLKFKWCEELKTFKFQDDSNLVHNHNPENTCNTKVSLNLFK